MRRNTVHLAAISLLVLAIAASLGLGQRPAPRRPSGCTGPAISLVTLPSREAARCDATRLPSPVAEVALENEPPTSSATPSVDGDGVWSSRIDDALAGPHVPDRLLIRFRPGCGEDARAEVEGALHAVSVEPLNTQEGSPDLADWYVLSLPSGSDLAAAMRSMTDRAAISVVEPDLIVRPCLAPDDESFVGQWGLSNHGTYGQTRGADIGALDAWEITTGSRETRVAVIDSGVDYNHCDLAPNIDRGASFVEGQSANADMDDFAPVYHGTQVAGIIGAVGNNGFGVSGVCWRVGIVPVKVSGRDGDSTTSRMSRGLLYAAARGASVVNISMGYQGIAENVADALRALERRGILVVAAAGNAEPGQPANDNDAYPTYPASYRYPNVLSVAATDAHDNLAPFSNYGATSVDLAAPGKDITSTSRGNSYRAASGTSMAAPHVAGVAALIRSLRPELTATQIKSAILRGVDWLPSLRGKCVRGGRLNAARALALVGGRTRGAPEMTWPVPGSRLTSSTTDFQWSRGTNVTGYRLQVGTDRFMNDIYETPSPFDGWRRFVSGLPTDGRVVSARLWYERWGVWLHRDYRFTAAASEADSTSPHFTSPAPGSRLTSVHQVFNWSTSPGVNGYVLDCGSTPRSPAHPVGIGSPGASQTLMYLPTDGQTLYARLWCHTGDRSESGSGRWFFVDSTFVAAGPFGGTAPPTITSPNEGSTLFSSYMTFTWSAVSHAYGYYLYIGSTSGGNDIVSSAYIDRPFWTEAGLPTDGRRLYVRVRAILPALYLDGPEVIFTAMTPHVARVPAITSPAPGSTLPGSTTTLRWTAGADVTRYWVWVGSFRGTHDLFDSGRAITQLWTTATGLPTDGRAVYVRLWWLSEGAWHSSDVAYRAARR